MMFSSLYKKDYFINQWRVPFGWYHSHWRLVIRTPFVPVSMMGSTCFLTLEAPASWPPRPALTPLGVVVSPAMSWPVLYFKTVVWNQTETTFNRSIIYCVTCLFVPFHHSICLLGIFQNSRPDWTWCTNWPDEMCNKVYKFWNEVYKFWDKVYTFWNYLYNTWPVFSATKQNNPFCGFPCRNAVFARAGLFPS